MKVAKDIEKLLTWAYLDELPKRVLNADGESGERYWKRLEQYGSLGGINIDEPSASFQRYAYVGEPHIDAIRIEAAVGRLGRRPFDWRHYFDLTADGLSALVTINDVRAGLRVPPEDPWRADVGPAPDRRGVRSKVSRDSPRDVLLVNTINVAALVTTHAVKRSRPDWRSEQMRCIPTMAERGGLAKVIGKSKAKNLYTAGSYCPLRWSPSPTEVVLTRADYVVWREALVELAATLDLTEHQVLAPGAALAPWIENEPEKQLHRSQVIVSIRRLPLKPERPRMGPPFKKLRKNKGRIVEVDRGSFP